MKLLLHIGTEKTGTTLIQKWLFQNKEVLLKNKIFISELAGVPNNRDLVAFFQSSLDDYMWKRKIHSFEQKDSYYKDFLNKFSAEIENAGKTCEWMIVTSELFHSRLQKDDELCALKSFFLERFESVQLLCYFREQSEMRKSQYSTVLKGHVSQPIEKFKNDSGEEDLYFNFYSLAKRWSSHFGKENCDFRIYDRSVFPQQDIRYDFISALGVKLNMSEFSFDIPALNESLTHLQALAYCEINKLVPYWGQKGGVNPENIFWKRFVDSLDFFKKGKIVDFRQENFYQLFVDSNQKLSDEFFDGRQLFKRPSTDSSSSEDVSSNETNELLLQFLKSVIKKFRGRVLFEKNLQFLRPIVAKYSAGDPLEDAEVTRMVEVLGAAIRPSKELK